MIDNVNKSLRQTNSKLDNIMKIYNKKYMMKIIPKVVQVCDKIYS
jgi:predicted nucleic-acid-binding Zn-ribbon protein